MTKTLLIAGLAGLLMTGAAEARRASHSDALVDYLATTRVDLCFASGACRGAEGPQVQNLYEAGPAPANGCEYRGGGFRDAHNGRCFGGAR